VKPKVYLETTIPSLLTAWPSRDLIIAADQQLTKEWWRTRRHDFELFISQVVLDEVAEGDKTAATARLARIRTLPILEVNADVEKVAKAVLSSGLIPPKASNDALHLAVAAVHQMHFLLTWNCRHLANAAIGGQLGIACRNAGFEMPVICTPKELMLRPYYEK
jgi:predicted nucleic acid-binding protein